MANNNNEGADNNPDNSKDSGLDKSIVGKFVSGIINSTPLSKWFGKDSKSTVRRREEDDEYDNSFVFQPPSKRAKLPLDIEHNNYSAHVFESPVIVHNASNNVNNVSSKVFVKFPEPAPGPSGIKSRNLFKRHDTASTNSDSINCLENQVDVVNGDNNDSDSEESTSGYSSTLKLVSKEKSKDVSTSKEVLESNTPKSRSLFTSTNDSGGCRSLFPEKSPQMNTSLSSRRPSFNASTFGSPNFVDRTLSTKRILSSPFYSGHTIYGGASAYGRKWAKSTEDLNASTRVQIKPINEKATNENATLSKTARRILTTLEQYSTPINDAKKIPVTPRKTGLLSSYVGGTPYLIRDRKKPSNKELQVPTIPDLLQMKQKERLQNSTETVRQIATHSKSSLNKAYKLRTEEDNKQKHSNKMKSSMRQKAQPIEPLDEVKLPKVSLPITTLPKFDFVLMPATSSSDTSKNEASKTTTMIKTPVSTITKPIVVDRKETEKKNVENDEGGYYIFSEPLVVSKEMKSVTGINCFKFSEPLCKKSSDSNFKTGGCKTKNNGENTTIAKPSSQLSGSVVDVLGNKSQSSSLNCDDKKMTESTSVTNDGKKNKCSAYDESKPEAKSKNKGNNGFGDQFKLSSDKWECGSCMVRNNNSDKNCVACGAAMPTDKQLPKSTFGDKFKPSASTWECTSCLIRNKNELNNCAACNTAKPVKENVVSSFGDNFKPSSDTWECGTCMIRNKNDVAKCVACETPKTGSKTTTTQKSGIFASPGEFAKPTFSFGIKQEWECKTCLIKNKNDLKKCAACEMPRDTSDTEKTFGEAFKMKGGEWECTSCMVKNKPTTDVCVCCGVAKVGTSGEKLSEISKTEEKKPVIGFNFGIDKSSSTQFKFGIPTTSTEMKETSVGVKATPSFSFGDPSKTNKAASGGFTFGINTQENRSPTKPLTSTSESAVIAGSPCNPLLKPNEKLPEKATPAPAGFKFGLDSSLNKNQIDAAPVVDSSNNKTEIPTSLGSKPVPMFEFKPPAINGDIGKPKPIAPFDCKFDVRVMFSGIQSEHVFPGEPSKPKESCSDVNKSRETPFSNKSTDSPSDGVGKLPEPGFSNNKAESSFVSMGKSAESFSNVSKNVTLPFADDKKAVNSPFGPVSEPARPQFGNVTAADKSKELLFGASEGVNKPHATLFGNVSDASKLQESLFVADANKSKDVLFGNKSTESGNLFSTPTSKPTFTFNPKPVENTTAFPSPSTSQSAPAASGIFKFGGDTSLKRTFGDTSDNNMSNGLGSGAKIPAFGGLQCFGSAENKPFAFGSSESAAKSSGFSFGQTDNKPNTTAPVFNFGNNASATPSAGFNFSAPSSGFKFGSAAGAGAAGASFGSAGHGAKNGSFNFGTNPNNNNQKAVFSFGANQTSQPTQPSFPTQNQAGFNFGAQAPQNPPPGNFNFAGAPPSFNFADGNSATAPPQRKIKKALRRTHR